MAIIGPGMSDTDYVTGRISSLDVFAGRIKNWILAFARTLAAQEDSGIAILLLASSVFEPMGGVLIDGGNSEAKFCAGFLRAIPDVPGGKAAEVAKMVCDLLRDGLFHEGFIKAGLVIEYGEVPVQIRSGAIVIDPRRFLNSVEVAFAAVCDEIRSGDQKNFSAYWDKKLRDQGQYVRARFNSSIGSVETSIGTAAVMPAESYQASVDAFSRRSRRWLRRAAGGLSIGEINRVLPPSTTSPPRHRVSATRRDGLLWP